MNESPLDAPSSANAIPVEPVIVIVDSAQKITEALIDIEYENVIGVDTETKPTFKKGALNKTALVQIATRNKVYLFRLNKIGLPFELARVFEDSKIQKIGIAVIQDMKELNDQYRPFKHNNVIDLNILCKSLDFKNIGARNLSGMVLGFRISKRQQTSNWEAQTLNEAQLRYAATDAWVAREIYLKLYHSKQFNF
mgnify:CR=1 FL=1